MAVLWEWCFNYVCACMSVCGYVHPSAGAHKSQKRVLGTPRAEVMGMGIEIRSSIRATNVLSH